MCGVNNFRSGSKRSKVICMHGLALLSSSKRCEKNGEAPCAQSLGQDEEELYAKESVLWRHRSCFGGVSQSQNLGMN
jgi:hypothetical protein